MADAIGWLSALLLLATLSRQVITQWSDRTSRGVSAWLVAGQIASSTGFIVYSVLLKNTVFVITNILILTVAIVGQFVYLRNRRRR